MKLTGYLLFLSGYVMHLTSEDFVHSKMSSLSIEVRGKGVECISFRYGVTEAGVWILSLGVQAKTGGFRPLTDAPTNGEIGGS